MTEAVTIATRITLITIPVSVAFLIFFRRALIQNTAVQKLTIFAILLSVSMGVDYVLFQLPPAFQSAENSGTLSIHYFYGASAAVIFTICELISAAYLARRDRRFMAWLLPPIMYLGAIGLVGAFWFDNIGQLFADTLRGAILIGLALWSNSQLKATRTGG